MRWVFFGDKNFERSARSADGTPAGSGPAEGPAGDDATGCLVPVLAAAGIALVFGATGAFGPGPEKPKPWPTPPAPSFTPSTNQYAPSGRPVLDGR